MELDDIDISWIGSIIVSCIPLVMSMWAISGMKG